MDFPTPCLCDGNVIVRWLCSEYDGNRLCGVPPYPSKCASLDVPNVLGTSRARFARMLRDFSCITGKEMNLDPNSRV